MDEPRRRPATRGGADDMGRDAGGADRGGSDRMTPARAVALIVDDSPVNRKLLARHLRTLDIEAREAADGRSALEILTSSGSDVAVVGSTAAAGLALDVQRRRVHRHRR